MAGLSFNPWVDSRTPEHEAMIRRWSENGPPEERLSESQIKGLILLLNAVSDRERDAFVPIAERRGDALRQIVEAKPPTCTEVPSNGTAWFMFAGQLQKIAKKALATE